MSHLFSRVALISVSIAFALITASCAPQISVHGNAPNETQLAAIEPGISTTFSVEEEIGRPSNTGLLRDNVWYYAQTTISRMTYHKPEVIDRTVVVISFDDDGVVENVTRYGLEDGRIINLNPRITEVRAKHRSVLAQIFGNLLNFNAGALTGN